MYSRHRKNKATIFTGEPSGRDLAAPLATPKGQYSCGKDRKLFCYCTPSLHCSVQRFPSASDRLPLTSWLTGWRSLSCRLLLVAAGLHSPTMVVQSRYFLPNRANNSGSCKTKGRTDCADGRGHYCRYWPKAPSPVCGSFFGAFAVL